MASGSGLMGGGSGLMGGVTAIGEGGGQLQPGEEGRKVYGFRFGAYGGSYSHWGGGGQLQPGLCGDVGGGHQQEAVEGLRWPRWRLTSRHPPQSGIVWVALRGRAGLCGF